MGEDLCGVDRGRGVDGIEEQCWWRQGRMWACSLTMH